MRRLIEALWAVFHDNEKEGTTRSGPKFLEKERHLAREYSPFSGSLCHMRPVSFVIRFRKSPRSVYAPARTFTMLPRSMIICVVRDDGLGI